MTTVAASAPDIAQFETYSLNDDQDDRTELIAGQDFDTIDEPIKATIMRDIRAIGQKITHVIFPRSNSTLLRDWDLWGPLFICIILSLLLKGYSDSHVDGNGNRLKTIGTAPEFAQIFLLIIIGSFTVTLNTSLLGGSISFFQSVCALGYCLIPLTITSLVVVLLNLLKSSTFLFFFKIVIIVISLVWSIYASTIFLSNSIKKERRLLIVYPIWLFYFIISWLVLSKS